MPCSEDDLDVVGRTYPSLVLAAMARMQNSSGSLRQIGLVRRTSSSVAHGSRSTRGRHAVLLPLSIVECGAGRALWARFTSGLLRRIRSSSTN
jgi:hypothetical protein